MDALSLAILSLATFRLSHMLSLEEGPGRVFARLRARLGVKHSPTVGTYAESFPGQLIACPLCLSVWLGAGLVVVWLLLPISQVIVAICAVSGLSCAIELGVRRP